MLNIKYTIEQYISIAKLKKIILLTILIVSFISIFYLGYFSYKKHINSKASKHLMELLERFYGAYSVGSTEALKEVEEEALRLYKLHSSSDLALFFLVCSAKSASEIQDYNQANQFFEDVLKKMSSKNPYYNVVNLLFAQSLLAEDSASNFDRAILLLENIINSNDKFLKDAAIYYKGLYLFMYKGLEQALNTWNILLNDPAYLESVWRERAKLAQNCNVQINNI
jgi:hypothetical protein